MPGLNGTGPLGQGALTGRGFGNCRATQFIGRNFFGFGRGLVRKRFSNASLSMGYSMESESMSKTNGIDELKKEATYVRNYLETIEKRIQDIENNK